MHKKMNQELDLCIDAVKPLIYIVAEEEDRVIEDIVLKTKREGEEAKVKKSDVSIEFEIFIYKSTTGICRYNDRVTIKDTVNFQNALKYIFEYCNEEKYSIFVLLDVEHYLSGGGEASHNCIRRLKECVLQSNDNFLKSIIIVSSDLVIPNKLQRYTEIIYYNLPDDKMIKDKVDEVLTNFSDPLQADTSITSVNQQENKLGQTNQSLIRSLKGLTLFEIEQICLSSMTQFDEINNKAVENHKRTILRRTKMLEFLSTDVSFTEVGGMDNFKNWAVEREGAWTEKGINLKIPLLKGVLLIGITGCGKTLGAKAVAKEWGLPLVQFNPSKVFSPRVGESESNIIKTLKTIESVAPVVVLIDEIEKQFAGSQSSTFSDSGTTIRVIGTFLTWYNDTTAPIFIVATCNEIQYLPPELISRFDDKFFVNIPSFEERKTIFQIQLDKYKKNWRKLNLNIPELAERSLQLTGREIEQVVKSSLHKMYHEIIVTKNDNLNLKQEHLLQVLDSKVPIVKTMNDEIKYLVKWVGWDDEKKEGIRANWANKRDVGDDIDKILENIKTSEDTNEVRKKFR